MCPPPPVHVALLTSTGMGHLTPLLRLAPALLSTNNCRITLVTFHPLLSSAESNNVSHLLTSFPQIHHLTIHLQPLDPSTVPTNNDPFFLQSESIRRSTATLLSPLLSSTTIPFSALVTDVFLASSVAPVAKELRLPNYVVFTSSAAMLGLCVYFPFANGFGSDGGLEIPGISTVPASSVVPPLRDPNNLFTTQFVENGRSLVADCDGILVNTFSAIESAALAALSSGEVVPGIPPVIAIGPLDPLAMSKKASAIVPSHVAWLDRQPERSVIYVSFGSRTAMTVEQLRELAIGLEKSGCRFLWVVKTKKVDREEKDDEEFDDIIGEGGYTERVKERGLVVKWWVEQEEVLGHKAVGGFLSHCGWNSVTEAASRGMRVLAWPRHGDQRVNAEVVERSGLGRWMREWAWEVDKRVVGGEEIGKKVKEFMDDGSLVEAAAGVGKEAVAAINAGGSSKKGLEELMKMLHRF